MAQRWPRLGAMSRSLRSKDADRTLRTAGDAWTLAVQMALLLGGCTMGGWYLGQRMGGRTGWTLAGAALGFVVSLYEVWKRCRGVGGGRATTAPRDAAAGAAQEQDDG